MRILLLLLLLISLSYAQSEELLSLDDDFDLFGIFEDLIEVESISDREFDLQANRLYGYQNGRQKYSVDQ